MNCSRRIIFFTALFLCATVSGLFAAQEIAARNSTAQEGTVTRRLGLFIGSNNGGRDRIMLRYAVSDARAVSRVFGDMGGIPLADNILLVEPTVAEINRRLDAAAAELSSAKRNSLRTELLFYYSGHSDEDGLLLNRERYSYRDLRERINRINTDMRIVILDSCSSGAITRAKGGVKTPPFLFDSSVSVEGYAFLTSSSADESSQESDTIESSYFTHSLVAGLRGAADTVGDGKVTLNELYRFAYAETLAKTETSIYGAQHPSYDMQVSGSGDVILTDIKETSASLLIDGDLTGRITIRDSSDFLVAELTKVNQKPMELGLEPGLYRITVQKDDNFYRTEVLLRENNRTPLTMADFSRIASATGNRNRGDIPDTAGAETVDGSPLYPVNIQLLPGRDLFGHSGENATNHLLLGLLVAKGHNTRGVGAALLGVMNSGYVQGVQASWLFNTLGGNLEGAQLAGLFNRVEGNVRGIQSTALFNNTSGDVTGIQSAGLFNITGGSLVGVQASALFNRAEDITGLQTGLVNVTGEGDGRGVQFGLVNFSDSENVLPVGLVNVAKNGMMHTSIFIDDMMFLNAGFRSGTQRFYTHFSTGVNRGFLSGQNVDRLQIIRAGFGFEYPINKFFVDIDVSAGSIINWDTFGDYRYSDDDDDWDDFFDDDDGSIAGIYQIRVSGGYKIFEHLGVFAGISYDYIYRHRNTFPNPKDFGAFMLGGTFGRHTHKLGFFGGVQF